MIDDLIVEVEVCIARITLLKAGQIVDADFTIVDFGLSRAVCGPL